MRAAAAPDPDALAPLPTDSAGEGGRRIIQVVAGDERTVNGEEARRRGLTLIDLSDGWAPSLLADGVGPRGEPLVNQYRRVFVGLANDRMDGEGRPLPPGEKNYLELYGVPPSLSVLRARVLADAQRDCPVDVAKLLAVDEIRTWGASTEKVELARHAARMRRLQSTRAALDAGTFDELIARDPKQAKEVREAQRFEAERAAFAEVERRLICDGLLDPSRHITGSYDTPMRLAVLAFQQRNVLLDQADLTSATLTAMTQPALALDFAALRRTLAERAAAAGGFIEDGSVVTRKGAPTYPVGDGTRRPVEDLVGAATAAVMDRLGLATPDDAVAFFRRHGARDFRALAVAVRLPPAPPYYAAAMDLSVEIDRGDVWYDFPFDAAGRRVPQPRQRFPNLTVFVRWQGERIPLVRWRTTVGGWRTELASDGQEYLRYKGSDVGARVWRHIVAAPVWIPPPSSPLGGMVKEKWINGAVVKVTNYDETGPGYLSAYGLAAAIHVQPTHTADGRLGYFDNGIRTHGSFDYASLRGRFSHGCHRLYNNLALRLFSWVVAHRRARPLGQVALEYRRTFPNGDALYDLRLPTRGFYYELDPPLPVEVLEGTVKGEARKPPAGYVRKPGVMYAAKPPPAVSGSPEDRAGGGPATRDEGEGAAP